MTKAEVKPDSIIAINGYDGDDATRIILVSTVTDSYVRGLTDQRNTWRTYSFSKIRQIQEVK